ncbi:hypothetical protein AB4K20DRAFT_1887398 [Rhizopus microsporus]
MLFDVQIKLLTSLIGKITNLIQPWTTFWPRICLEKARVIECSYPITCKPHYPEDLYQLFGDNKQQVIESLLQEV